MPKGDDRQSGDKHDVTPTVAAEPMPAQVDDDYCRSFSATNLTPGAANVEEGKVVVGTPNGARILISSDSHGLIGYVPATHAGEMLSWLDTRPSGSLRGQIDEVVGGQIKVTLCLR